MVYSELRGHQVICSAFIEKDKKILIVLCPRFQVWRVPWGRAEHGEKIEDTPIREMQEEVGITFLNPRFVGFGQDQQFHVRDQKETSRLIMFFHVNTDQEVQVDPDEALEYKWVSIEELKRMELVEGAVKDFFQRNPDFTYSQDESSTYVA